MDEKFRRSPSLLYPYFYSSLLAPNRFPALKTSCFHKRDGKAIVIETEVFTAEGLVGTAQSIDLDEIIAPPDDKSQAVFSAGRRDGVSPRERRSKP